MGTEPEKLPDEAEAPTQLIQRLLDERGWNQRTLAMAMGLQPALVNRLVLGKRPIDAFAAIVLGDVFGVPAERFMSAQVAADLAKARAEIASEPKRATRAELFSALPIAEMMTRRWIRPTGMADVAGLERELTRFFGVDRIEDIAARTHAAKKTNAGEDATPIQTAWLRRVELIASEMLVGRYSPAAVRAAVQKLDALLAAPGEARHVPKILADAGVRFVIVETLTSARIDGVCLWLNDLSPVIGMTVRHDRIDNFWFVLRHELEHVIRGHGRDKAIIDVDLLGDGEDSGRMVSDEERVADAAAENFCVPKDQMDRFYTLKKPYFSERDVLGFAATLKLHPGLVVGQLQYRSGRFDRLRHHLAKIRHVVTPGAAVDGWGDVYPLG